MLRSRCSRPAGRPWQSAPRTFDTGPRGLLPVKRGNSSARFVLWSSSRDVTSNQTAQIFITIVHLRCSNNMCDTNGNVCEKKIARPSNCRSKWNFFVRDSAPHTVAYNDVRYLQLSLMHTSVYSCCVAGGRGRFCLAGNEISYGVSCAYDFSTREDAEGDDFSRRSRDGKFWIIVPPATSTSRDETYVYFPETFAPLTDVWDITCYNIMCVRIDWTIYVKTTTSKSSSPPPPTRRYTVVHIIFL